MVSQRFNTNLIYTEFGADERLNWFDLKEKKFLHNIDTFYYSVKLLNDFREDTKDKSCIRFREYFSSMKEDMSVFDFVPLYIPGYDEQLNYVPFSRFGGYYNIRIECPDMFDIFFASSVPQGADGQESVTSEIIVQLRSYMLWQYGATKAFEESYRVLKAICDYFNLQIGEVKENRVDFCWHSNYLQNPDKFFAPHKMAERIVTTLGRKDRKGILTHYDITPMREVEMDYIAIGNRNRDKKVFVRIYMKSKEVVEKGYKPWFFKEWLFNGLINRYDFYVYEKAFLKKSWNYIDMARLEFYAEYGSNKFLQDECAAIVSGSIKKDAAYIAKLADKLTPRVTIITNVEFETSRKFSKNIDLKFLKDNEDKAECRRIYDYLDNRALISEYLTRSVFRLAEPSDTDINISRADNCGFWDALRSCKMVDVKKSPRNLKLIRNYTRQLNKEVVKNRIKSAMVTLSIYEHGFDNVSSIDDAVQFICSLNDNDIHDMDVLREKRKRQLNKVIYENPLPHVPRRRIRILDEDTGEIL